MLKVIFLLIFSLFSAEKVYAQEVQASKLKWTSELPEVAKDPELWKDFIDQLEKNKMYFSMLASGIRMMLFFEDVNSKKFAYETIIKVIDYGYPNSLLHLFIIGSLEEDGSEEFAQNYNFYKAVVNKMKHMEKWSKSYFEKLDAEKFNKYKFYKAIEFYGKKEYKEAETLLNEILKSSLSLKDFSFIKKVARLKARIYFEQKDYEKSLAIYNDFLLKTNPITPTDWLEKSWNLFYLKRYEDTLGTLYNLESEASKQYQNFEKYIIRASIYMDLCAVDNVQKLVEGFEQEFKTSIDGIINGKQLQSLPDIEKIARFSNPKYKESIDSLNALTQEREKLQDLSEDVQVMGNYLYDSEIKVLRQLSLFYRERALNKSAQDLTMLNESLKFLQFGTEREKYNPAIVFQPKDDLEESLVEQIDLADRGFIFQWKQQGQFWRDERNKYKGSIKDQCLIE